MVSLFWPLEQYRNRIKHDKRNIVDGLIWNRLEAILAHGLLGKNEIMDFVRRKVCVCGKKKKFCLFFFLTENLLKTEIKNGQNTSKNTLTRTLTLQTNHQTRSKIKKNINFFYFVLEEKSL